MLKLRAKSQYYEAFAKFQTFSTVKEMFDTIKRFVATYELTPSIESVLNTIKLHAKNYVGVCWLYREQIAEKAKVSLSSVDRAIAALKEVGILTVHNMIHTKRGGKTHNVYVINNTFSIDHEESQEESYEESNDASLDLLEDDSKPCYTSVSGYENSNENSYKNLNTNSHTDSDINIESPINIDNKGIDNVDEHEKLKYIPQDFLEIMNPYYANSPDVIASRWKTTCIALKRYELKLNDAIDTVKQSWKLVVNRYKKNLIKNATDDNLGGYYYRVLYDMLFSDALKKTTLLHDSQ